MDKATVAAGGSVDATLGSVATGPYLLSLSGPRSSAVSTRGFPGNG
jgi:hypothetical protein